MERGRHGAEGRDFINGKVKTENGLAERRRLLLLDEPKVNNKVKTENCE